MKLPSCTVRTRSFAGSKISVRVIVESRDASVIASGTVYGPPPTRNDVLGAEMSTCADPMPLDVLETAGGAPPPGGVCGGCPCGDVGDVGDGGAAGDGAAGGAGGAAGSGVTAGVAGGG
jgi:hypothetical protein